MKFDARMLNLLGLLAIVVVLGLGTISIVMPLYEGVQNTENELSTAHASNDSYRMKLVALTSAEQRKAETEASVATLQTMLPAHAESHTVLEVIANAFESSGAVISKDVFAPSTSFSPRIAPTEDGVTAEPTPEPAADTPTQTPEDPGAAGGAAAQPAASSQGSGDNPARQIEVTLTVSVSDAAMATRFLDALAAGPRALVVTAAFMSDGSTPGMDYDLEVTLMAFYYETEVK